MTDVAQASQLPTEPPEMQQLREQNQMLQRAIGSLNQVIVAQKETFKQFTGEWNSITVMGQVETVFENMFTLRQGGLAFAVTANAHPCSAGDWVMVMGGLSQETDEDTGERLIITAYHIEGIATAAPQSPVHNGNGIPPVLGAILG